MKQSRVGVIVVNWNRADDTICAYNSLKSSNFQKWHLYVIDNASEDNSSEILSDNLIDKATLILNDVNSGFSGGCNIGVGRAILDGSTHIFLLNNDAVVLSSTIERLINESMHLNNNAILGCAVKFYGTEKFQFFGSRTREDVGQPSWFDENDSEKLSGRLIETDFILGAALFAPTQIWHEVGQFDERFYLNYEETDWCYRARKFGFQCYVVSDAVALHRVGANIGPIGGPMQNYFSYRNELLFASNHATLNQKKNIFIRTAKNLLKSLMRDILNFGRLKPATIAHAIALYDFGRKKFGDCPAIIRKFARAHPSI